MLDMLPFLRRQQEDERIIAKDVIASVQQCLSTRIDSTKNNKKEDGSDGSRNYSEMVQWLEQDFVEMIRTDPSIASKKYLFTHSGSNLLEEKKSLLHHLCVKMPRTTCPVGVIKLVFEAYPDAVTNDPMILSTLCRETDHRLEFLELVGMVGERWPKAYDHLEELPEVACDWKQLVDVSVAAVDAEQQGEQTFSLFKSYPHLIKNAERLDIDCKGIEQQNETNQTGEVQKDEVDNTLDSSRASPSASREYESIRSQRLQQILQQFARSRGVVSFGEIIALLGPKDRLSIGAHSRMPGLEESPPAKKNDLHCSLYDFLGAVLPFLQASFAEELKKSNGRAHMPIHKELSILFVEDEDGRNSTIDSTVTRMTEALAGFHVLKCYWADRRQSATAISHRVLNVFFGMVAEHPAMRELMLQSLKTSGEDGLVHMSRLVNLKKLEIFDMDLSDAYVPHLAKLVDVSDSLQHLELHRSPIHSPELLMAAVGRSRSLRVFRYEFNGHGHRPLLEILVGYLEGSNTTLLRVEGAERLVTYFVMGSVEWQNRRRPDGGREHDCASMDDASDDFLLLRLDFMCALNRIGRYRLSSTALTKEGFVLDILAAVRPHYDRQLHAGDVWPYLDPRHDDIDTRITSVLYWFLKENPTVWST